MAHMRLMRLLSISVKYQIFPCTGLLISVHSSLVCASGFRKFSRTYKIYDNLDCNYQFLSRLSPPIKTNENPKYHYVTQLKMHYDNKRILSFWGII